MKKILFVFLALLSIVSANAATKDDGFLSASSNMTVSAGSSVKIPVSLTNKIDIYGVQCDIYLSSSDLSFPVTSKGKYVFGTNADRVDGQTESSKLQTDGAVRYMLADYTAENPFAETSGELFYINVNVSESASGEYTVTLKGITLATDENKILGDDIVIKLTVPESPSKIADRFKTDHATILGKTTSTVASSDLDAINAALDAYNSLDAEVKSLLTTEKSLIDSLKTKAEELKAAEEADAAATAAANKFKTDNAAILAKTTATVKSSDLTSINKALEDYNSLSAAAKAKVATQKSLLDSLKAKAEELKAAEEADAAATAAANQFKTDNAAILAKTTATVTSSDLAAINKALEDYNALSAAAKAKLTNGEKSLLDALKAKAEELKAAEEAAAATAAANKFKTDNAAILAKTTATVTSSDLTAINKALEDYNALSDDAKAKLTNGEKSLLDALKAKAEELKADEDARATIVQSGSCGNNVNFVLYNDGTLVMSGTGKMDNYMYAPWYSNRSMINKVVIENGVTSIVHDAFKDCSSLISITIPNSVTNIGSFAFSGCSSLPVIDNIRYADTYLVEVVDKSCTTAKIKDGTRFIGFSAFFQCANLTSITIPNSVTSIADYAFYECTSLISVTLSNSLTSLENNVFEGCSGLAAITIPNSVTSIGNYTFEKCSSLKTVLIPNSVTSIGDFAFVSCKGLKSIVIPNSVSSIGAGAFRNCSGLTSLKVEDGNPQYSSMDNVIFNKNKTELICCAGGKEGEYTVPNSVTSIGGSAFCSCSGLTSVTIGISVTSIGDYAFYECSGLTSVTIGNSVTNIGESAFIYCSGLTSVTIPNSVTSIGRSAFYSCSGLTSVTIGNSVTSIGGSAFYSCSALKEIYSLNPIPQSVGIGAFEKVYKENTIVFVPGESVEAYKAADGWKEFNNITSIEVELEATAAANQFKTDYATILGKTTETVTSSDLAAINKAIEDYNALSDTAKAKLTNGEKALLDALKAKAEELKAAEDAADSVTTDISQMKDVLYSAEMKVKSGSQIVLPIYMKNSAAVTLFQTNVYLPNGFSFAKKTNGKYAVSLVKDRLTDEDDNHVISSNVQPDGSLLILCSSQDNYTFDGNDGQVATVTIDVADDVAEGQYLVKLNNQKMVRPDNTGENVLEYKVVLTVKNYTLGDVNDDGDIDGYDLVGISNLILGTNTDGLVRDAADVNSDGDVDGYDYVMEVNTILGTNISAAKAIGIAHSENVLSNLTMTPVSVIAGEQAQLTVGMECNGDVFTLVQTDIEFPEGVKPMMKNGRVVAKLAGECLDGDDHSISCVKQSNGKYRLLIASQKNAGLTGKNGQLFTIGLETAKGMCPGMYDITLSNTKLVRANNTGVNPSDVTSMMVCNDATGINTMESDKIDEPMYNLNGQRVSKHVQHGIYIIKGKKKHNKYKVIQ